MQLVVAGASSYRSVLGIPADDPRALLQAVGAQSSEPVIVLAPLHAASGAREQAHVLVAANRWARVCVLPLDHHALTLALLADTVLADPAGDDGWPDPGVAVQQVKQLAARSRSLVWYPRLWGLDDPTPTVAQVATGVFRSTGYFRELGPDAHVVSGRVSCPVAAGDIVHLLAGAPTLLLTQLGQARAVPVDLTVEPGPYWARTTVELTVLDESRLPALDGAPCPTCGAGLLEDQCVFCGSGPVAARQLVPITGGRSVAPGPRSRVEAAPRPHPYRLVTAAAGTQTDTRGEKNA